MPTSNFLTQASNIRALFELPPDVTYLNCANMAPQLRSVHDAGIWAIHRRDRPWEITDWFSEAEQLRTLAAGIMSADSDGVALIPAASYGIAIAAANLPVKRNQQIVLMHHEFPSNYYSWEDLAKKQGGEIVVVNREPGENWTEALSRNINSQTAIVSVSQCHWTDGSWVNLEEIGERARKVGAALVVDASQALGAVPMDLSRIQPDFLVSVGYKWMLGPYGLGYLYVAPQWRDGTPLERSWLARAGSEDFSRLVEYTSEFRAGARRFDMGEFPHFHIAPMAVAALQQIRAWGVSQISATISHLTDRVAKWAEGQGYGVQPKEDRAPHLIGIRKTTGVPPGLSGYLRERNIFVSIRGDAIRVAPHLYNSISDVDRLLQALEEATESQAA